MTILATDHTKSFITGDDGFKIGRYLVDFFKKTNYNEVATISFYGVDFMTPSFVNGAFLYLIDLFGEEFFKKNVKVTQATNSIAQILRSSIQSYFEYKKKFWDTVKTNKIYCAIDGSNESSHFRRTIYEDTKNQEIKFLFNTNDAIFGQDAKNNISNADVFIGIITEGKFMNRLIEQVNFALENNKKCLMLCKEGIELHIPTSIRNNVMISYYNNTSYYDMLRNVNELILNKKIPSLQTQNGSQGTKNANDVLLWTLLGAGAVLLLAALTEEQKK
jgi:hypothetical protein